MYASTNKLMREQLTDSILESIAHTKSNAKSTREKKQHVYAMYNSQWFCVDGKRRSCLAAMHVINKNINLLPLFSFLRCYCFCFCHCHIFFGLLPSIFICFIRSMPSTFNHIDVTDSACDDIFDVRMSFHCDLWIDVSYTRPKKILVSILLFK